MNHCLLDLSDILFYKLILEKNCEDSPAPANGLNRSGLGSPNQL
jgi:hypothetical protein